MESVRCAQPSCLNLAYETLRMLCMEHYRLLVVAPIWKAFCEAETLWHEVEHDLYQVEVALGMRGRILALTISPQEGRKERMIRDYTANPPRALARREKHEQLLIDEEDIESDI